MADEQTRINALSGGAPLPQADTMTIARRLLGPGIAERYGDVIGARPTNAGDIARDFSMGFISGDPGRADAVKMQVAQAYNQELRREDDQRMQAEQAAREQMSGFFRLLDQGRSVPKDLKKEFFQEGLTKLGVEATSPLFVKILTNSDKFGDIYDALGDADIRRMADEDPLGAVEQLTTMGHDGAAALQVVQSVQQMKRYRAETQRILSQAARKSAGIGRAPKDPRDSVIAKLTGRQIMDEATGEKRLMSPDEIQSYANKLYPQTPAAGAGGIPQAPMEMKAGEVPVAEAAQVAEQPAAPVGIAQKTAGAPDAVAAAKKRLGL